MSFLANNARHPNIDELSSIWKGYREQINTIDLSALSDIPGLTLALKNIERSRRIEYLQSTREIVGANAIRALAKCYEALDAVKRCDDSGVSTMAMVASYNASFFAARSLCMLLGFQCT